jgi:hypothetical protein
MSLSKKERRAIAAVICRLRGEANANGDVNDALVAAPVRNYLESWVIGALGALLDGGDRNASLAVSLADYNWKEGKGPSALLANLEGK